MPYATEVPHIEIAHLDEAVHVASSTRWASRASGEAGVIPGSAVLAAAIEDATGVVIARMPVSPSELFELQGGPA